MELIIISTVKSTVNNNKNEKLIYNDIFVSNSINKFLKSVEFEDMIVYS